MGYWNLFGYYYNSTAFASQHMDCDQKLTNFGDLIVQLFDLKEALMKFHSEYKGC